MRVPQPGEQFGRYRLDRKIGQGGMGVVYASTDSKIQRTVAVKVITGPLAGNEEFLRRFHAEASVLAQLDSPYVVQITDHDEVDGIPYIVTQYVEGTDLASYLGEEGPLPAKAALTLAAQVARGLGDAHRRGVIHRDIKPGNILVRAINTPDMHAYVCDFGIARTDDSGELTATGMVAGTWTYLAPERTQGAPATASSDLYALGCLLWASLTGKPPYEGTDVELLLAHAQKPVPRLPGADPFTTQLNGVIARLMAKDPKDRYADAAAARADLEALAATAPTTVVTPPTGSSDPTAIRPAPPTGPREPAASAPRKKRTGLLVAAVVAALLVLGGGATAAVLAMGDDQDDTDGERDSQEQAEAITKDVDGDGTGDLLLLQERDILTTVATWLVPSNGTSFGEGERMPAEQAHPAIGDVDGDGTLDTAWFTTDDEIWEIVVVPGEGERWEQTMTLPQELNVYDGALMLADVTGDGLDDLVLPGGDGDTARDALYVAVSNGDDFAEPTQWWASEHEYGSFWVGDFDGDDSDDVLYWRFAGDEADGNYGGGEFSVLEAEDETFEATATRAYKGAAISPLGAPIEVGDADGDGTDEMVIYTAKGRRILLIKATEDGLTDPETVWFVKLDDGQVDARLDDYTDTVMVDVDGDRDDDMIEVSRPEDGTMTFTVWKAEDGAYADPTEWGSMTCTLAECEDSFTPLD